MLLASNLLNCDAELMHAIASCQSGNTVSRAVPLSKKIPNHSQIFLNETNIFKVLLERLFWFTRKHRRISWTFGTGSKQCKSRHNIKWIGLENCRINNMRLKCCLRSTYSWVSPIGAILLPNVVKDWDGSHPSCEVTFQLFNSLKIPTEKSVLHSAASWCLV